MEGLDFGVNTRVGGVNNGYVSKPQDLQPVEKRLPVEKKRTFDKSYCQSVQAYFAPNFIKAGDKPCSVTQYTAKLRAAGLVEGKDFEVKGHDSENDFGLEIIIKDCAGRDKKSTYWENGLEADNFAGYDKYSYNSLDPSYKKISHYASDNSLLDITETTKAIAQKDFTPDNIDFNTKPKEYAAKLKAEGRKFEASKETYGENNECLSYNIDEKNSDGSLKQSTQWYLFEGKLNSVSQEYYDENECIQKRISFNPDGSTSMTHYFN